MATRFGRVSPTQSYTIKIRWILGTLFLVIVILLVALMFLVKEQDAPVEGVVAAPVEVQAPIQSNKAEITIAKVRVEDATQIQRVMLDSAQWDLDRLPPGVVYYRDVDSIVGKFSKGVLMPNMPVLREQLQDTQPMGTFNIPPGYRAITIEVNTRSGVEGFARPNSRVDVLFTYADRDGRKKISTIVRFTKVLSVGGVTQVGPDGRAPTTGATPITLLVTEKDAKKIELARTLGELSLSLVGEQEPGKVADDPDTIDINSIVGGGQQTEAAPEEPSGNVMMFRDPKTGRLVRMFLKNGRWVKDENF